MKTINNNTEKRIYLQPQIECIKLDNEISLALESTPPEGDNEVFNNTPNFINNDPFKTNIV
jgi:hypothetical protein